MALKAETMWGNLIIETALTWLERRFYFYVIKFFGKAKENVV